MQWKELSATDFEQGFPYQESDVVFSRFHLDSLLQFAALCM
jgi:hypothetical protein